MLEPNDRSPYLEALRPPEGYQLDRAIGTTYSVDLLTLLAVPLSFAQLDWADDRDELLADPISVLRSLREYASKITLFCQAGRIAMPTRRHPLFAYLEPMLVEAAASEKNGEFHAKTWLLRFVGSDEDPVRYRFLCLSRNLTTDRSWDTVLTLEGDLQQRVNAIARNHPLGEFLEALPGLARASVPERLRTEIEVIAKEARRVRFDPPEPFEDLSFFPLGIEGYDGLDLKTGGASRLLVVSPFVTKGFLEEIAQADENLLVSRQESLDELGAKALACFDRTYVLDDGAELDVHSAGDDDERGLAAVNDPGADARETEIGARGLHAKLFVVERGWDADVLTGSANASSAAFERNVEFLVQLTGKKSKVGIRALLGDAPVGFLFGNLLQEYRPCDEKPVIDEEARANEKAVEDARRAFSRAELVARVTPGFAEGLFDLRVELRSGLSLPKSVRARCWPSTLRQPDEWNAKALVEKSALTFERLSLAQLTAFLSVEAVAGEGETARAVRFALVLPLEGAPEDRLEQVLAAMLDEPGQFVRFLVLLLQEDDQRAAAALLRPMDRENGAGRRAEAGWLPLLEDLLHVLARSPERLREVHRLVEDLKKSPAGRKVLPEGFADVWEPIWEASGATP
jgi:hypothetical protein